MLALWIFPVFDWTGQDYFSPQAFAHIGVPFRWSRNDKLQFDVVAEPGMNWFREDEAPFFPLDPARQAARSQAINLDGTPVLANYPGRSSMSFALNLKSRIAYPITNDLKLALDVNLHTAADYQELWAGLNIIFDFATRRQSGVAQNQN